MELEIEKMNFTMSQSWIILTRVKYFTLNQKYTWKISPCKNLVSVNETPISAESCIRHPQNKKWYTLPCYFSLNFWKTDLFLENIVSVSLILIWYMVNRKFFYLKFMVIPCFQNKFCSCSRVSKSIFSKLKNCTALIVHNE